MHCHPSKKTAFIVLEGKALFKLEFIKKIKRFIILIKLVLRPSISYSESVSKKGLYALEFETPYDRNDLLRFKDKSGRKSKNYEGSQHTKKILNNSF